MFFTLFVVFIHLLFHGANSRLDETVKIMTRDDVALLTRIWYPDEKIFPPPWTTLYEDSPYSVDDLELPSADYFTSLGYAYMGQEQRGREGSNGTYSFFRTSGNDTLDTIKWWLKNANWSNGLLAVDGISADCLAQYADLTGVTQSGYWPNGNYSYFLYLFEQILTGALALGNGMGHETVYQGGAYRECLISGWLQGLGENSTIRTILENEAFGKYWYTLDGRWENQWNIINVSFINFAGWYDIFGSYQIETIMSVNETAWPGARGQQLLIVDPGGHCPMGAILWDYDFYGWEYLLLDTIPEVFFEVFRSKKEQRQFNIHNVVDWNVLFYMLGPGGSGTKGNFWVKALSFPPIIRNESWYLATNGQLINNSGLNNSDGYLSYLYNPFDPVPTWGGNNLICQPCGPQNQEIVEKERTDILHFQSAPFSGYYAIVGPIQVYLFVSSDAVDTDFTAKIMDLYEDGRSMLVQDSILRMRWRGINSDPWMNETAPPMVKGKIYNITIDIGYMSWIFNPGHVLRISISSSNHKRFSINYNSGLFVINGSTNAVNATNTIYYGSSYPSRVELPVVDLDWVEKHKVTEYELNNIQDNTKGRVTRDVARRMKSRFYNRV